jgi:DNA repair ATPase RecN
MISTVRELQRALSARDQELRDRDSRLSQLERELREKEAQITQLRAELDKCHQVLKPMVQQISSSLQATYLSSPGRSDASQIAPWRTAASSSGYSGSNGSSLGFYLQQNRTKRLAISAEPLPHSVGNASLSELRKLRIQRAPKSES